MDNEKVYLEVREELEREESRQAKLFIASQENSKSALLTSKNMYDARLRGVNSALEVFAEKMGQNHAPIAPKYNP